jgi:hypothetical protein
MQPNIGDCLKFCQDPWQEDLKFFNHCIFEINQFDAFNKGLKANQFWRKFSSMLAFVQDEWINTD